MESSSGATVTVERLTIKTPLEHDDLDEELLPGIPNDITLSEINPKLSWRDPLNLSSLSPHWEKAIRGHVIHNERVRTQSAVTLAVVAQLDIDSIMIRISLYSIRDKSFFELPPIPGLPRGFPLRCQSVSLGSKLYILGGKPAGTRRERLGTKTVYMLDLAAQRRSKQCASMGEPRQDFGASAINGKIYVFGGGSNGKLIRESEVYDPKVDSWCGIQPMISEFRVNHRVATIGEELLIYGGDLYTFRHGSNDKLQSMGRALSLEIYHPLRDEWRLIGHWRSAYSTPHFTVEGRLHRITPWDIDICVDTNLWSHLQSCLFPRPVSSEDFKPISCLVIEGEILLAVQWHFYNGYLQCLLQSKGFGDKTSAIQWEIVGCVRSTNGFGLLNYELLCSIQL